jgi:hypothetical protein
LDFNNLDQFFGAAGVFLIGSVGVNGFEVVVFGFNFFAGDCPTPFTVASGGEKFKEIGKVVGG